MKGNVSLNLIIFRNRRRMNRIENREHLEWDTCKNKIHCRIYEKTGKEMQWLCSRKEM